MLEEGSSPRGGSSVDRWRGEGARARMSAKNYCIFAAVRLVMPRPKVASSWKGGEGREESEDGEHNRKRVRDQIIEISFCNNFLAEWDNFSA